MMLIKLASLGENVISAMKNNVEAIELNEMELAPTRETVANDELASATWHSLKLSQN